MSSKFNVMLLGKHAKRTPLYYDGYRELFLNNNVSISSADVNRITPDAVITGFHIDLAAEAEKIKLLKKKNRDLKVIVLSEEPLWDLTWHPNPFEVKHTCKASGIEYLYFNHYNTDIYNLKHVPYFLTTEAKYLSRYVNLLMQYTAFDASKVLEIWKSNKYILSSFVEKRIDEKYNKMSNCGKYSTYSNFRSSLTSHELHNERVQIQGKGWSDNKARQSLHDWHADKLSRIKGHSTYLLAIENVDAPYYVTEKIFDAYATCNIPLIVDSQLATFSHFFKPDAAITISKGFSGKVSELLESQALKRDFAERYLETIKYIANKFKDRNNLIQAKNRVAIQSANLIIEESL